MVFLPFLSAGSNRRHRQLITRCYLSCYNRITLLNKLQPVIYVFLTTLQNRKNTI